MAFTAQDLNKTQLPRKRDVIEYLLFNQGKPGNKGVKLARFVNDVAKEVTDLWENLQIPLVTRKTIRARIDRMIPLYRNVVKNPLQFNEDNWNELLVLSKCACFCEADFKCNCTPQTPLQVMEFLRDQRCLRMLTIPGNNSTGTVSPNLVSWIGPSTSAGYEPEAIEIEDVEATQAEIESSSSDDNGISLPKYAALLERMGISSHVGAVLATSLMKDLNIPHAVIDPNKLSIERKKVRGKFKKAV